LTLFFIEFVDSGRQQNSDLGAKSKLEGIFLGASGNDRTELVATVGFKLRLKTGEVEAAKFAEELLKFGEWKAQTPGKLGLGRCAVEFGGEFAIGVLNAARLAAEIARAPVHLPKAVQNGAANAKAGVRLELHILAGVEFIDCVDQAENAGVDKIVKRNVGRKAIVNATGDVANVGQVFSQESLTLGGIERSSGF